MSAAPGNDEARLQAGNVAQQTTLSPKNSNALPKTQDPLVGWFNLGRNVKPRRVWKGGRK